MVSILLASASERRRDILSEIVNETVQLESRALASNEINPSSGIEVSERVELICSAKAEAAAQEIAISGELPDLVIVSDTLVEDPTDPLIALGQPIDELVAASMLLELSGRRHRVWSCTAILYSPAFEKCGSEILHAGWTADIWSESAVVEFDELTQDELADLVSSGSWKGKAGAYDLAGLAGEHASLIDGAEVTVLGFASSAMEIISSLIG